MQVLRQASRWIRQPRIGVAAQSIAPKFTAVLAIEASIADLTRKVVALEKELKVTKTEVATWFEKAQNTKQTLPQNDPALEAFDRLRVRKVGAGYDEAAFLAEFQSTAASLEPDERIELMVYAHNNSMELLKAVLADPQANKICALRCKYYQEEDMNFVIPLLINNCPELASLEVYFQHHSAFDFVSSVLEHPSNRIKVLEVLTDIMGDIPRFFAALGRSQVSALTLSHSPKSVQGFYEYLAKDLLVRLKVGMKRNQVPPELLMSLSKCTRLAKLEMLYCDFSQPTAFTLPKSITKLVLRNCTFVGGVDWSFLAGSNVRKLDFESVRGVDGNQLGVHLRAKGLDKLRFAYCGFVNETLVGVGLGRIKRLDLGYSNLNDASVELIALALQSLNSEMKELVLRYDDNTAKSIEDHLVPALKHPNCNLVKLYLWTGPAMHREAARRVEDMFRNRLALFVARATSKETAH
ncbi:hypothetical protein BASA81_015157 [Batrachochytrium salamandrivorans]|nr:hypothetical protein BASA81_015157 [Batrachochytrium salamandrivorans]